MRLLMMATAMLARSHRQPEAHVFLMNRGRQSGGPLGLLAALTSS